MYSGGVSSKYLENSILNDQENEVFLKQITKENICSNSQHGRKMAYNLEIGKGNQQGG